MNVTFGAIFERSGSTGASPSGYFDRSGGTKASASVDFESSGGTRASPNNYFERSDGIRAGPSSHFERSSSTWAGLIRQLFRVPSRSSMLIIVFSNETAGTKIPKKQKASAVLVYFARTPRVFQSTLGHTFQLQRLRNSTSAAVSNATRLRSIK